MRVRTFCCVLVASLLASASAKKVKGVKALDEKSWKAIIGGPRPVLVKFWKPDCPNCEVFEPTYKIVGRVFRNESRVVIGAVDVNAIDDLTTVRACMFLSTRDLICTCALRSNGQNGQRVISS